MTNNQHAFITEYLQHRSLFTAYCLAYNVQDESDYENIMLSAHLLMDDPEVGGRIRSVLSNMHSEVEQQIRKELQTTLLTVQRKRELLAQIATGEMYAVQTYKGKDCTQCTQHAKPTINPMLKAIDLDNKLAGHYSVGSSQFTVDNSQSAKSEKVVEMTTETSRNLGENTITGTSPAQQPHEIKNNQTHNKTQQSTPLGSTLTVCPQLIVPNKVGGAGVPAGRGWNTRKKE